MGGGGSIQGMSTMLRNNKGLLRKKVCLKKNVPF